MSCPIDRDEINKLKVFIDFCSAKPKLLHLPQLSFFKAFVEKLGGKIPESDASHSSTHSPDEPKTAKSEESQPHVEPEIESDPETDVDIDNEGCIEPDTDTEHPMGDATKTATDEEIDQANELSSLATGHYAEQRYEDAIACYEKAILLNPTEARFYAKRGQAYLKLNKPHACLRDCNRALELNCQSCQKIRRSLLANLAMEKKLNQTIADWLITE